MHLGAVSAGLRLLRLRDDADWLAGDRNRLRQQALRTLPHLVMAFAVICPQIPQQPRALRETKLSSQNDAGGFAVRLRYRRAMSYAREVTCQTQRRQRPARGAT